jgi:hypothetical protein
MTFIGTNPDTFVSHETRSLTHTPPHSLYIMPFIDLCTNLEKIDVNFPLDIDSLKHILSTVEKLQKLSMTIDPKCFEDKDTTSKL